MVLTGMCNRFLDHVILWFLQGTLRSGFLFSRDLKFLLKASGFLTAPKESVSLFLEHLTRSSFLSFQIKLKRNFTVRQDV